MEYFRNIPSILPCCVKSVSVLILATFEEVSSLGPKNFNGASIVALDVR